MLSYIMIGAGGHARVLLDKIPVNVLGLVDSNAQLHGLKVGPYQVLGDDGEILKRKPYEVRLVNGIGSTKTMSLRKEVYKRFKSKDYYFVTVTHASAVYAENVFFCEGAQVMAGAVLQTGVIIGENSLINTGALIDHDCHIGAHVHIAPGCVLSGNVRVGDETHIGTGATIIQGITIGRGCLVAAGAVVIRDVPDGATVMGVPAKERPRA